MGLLGVVASATAQAQDLGVVQLVLGTVAASAATAGQPAVAAEVGDYVSIVNSATGALEGSIPLRSGGAFSSDVQKASTFNSTQCKLLLTKGTGATYALLGPDGNQQTFIYSGITVFQWLAGTSLPQTEVAVRVGTLLSGGPPPPSGEGTPAVLGKDCLASGFDVNRDGTCDEADIEVIRTFVAAHPLMPKPAQADYPEDVNRDGVVTMRDILDAQMALQRARLNALRRDAVPARPARPVIERPALPASANPRQEVDALRESLRKTIEASRP